MSDSSLSHDRDGDGGHDLFDHFWVGHAGYAALGADVCWYALVYVSLCVEGAWREARVNCKGRILWGGLCMEGCVWRVVYVGLCMEGCVWKVV